MQVQLGIACALVGSIITFAFGTWNEALTFLLVVMAIDYITGVIAATRDGTGLNSGIGFWGLFKKGLMLIVVLLAHRADVLLGVEVAMGGAVYFYIANELLSIIENYGRMGLPIPDRLRKVVQILRDRAGEKAGNASEEEDPVATPEDAEKEEKDTAAQGTLKADESTESVSAPGKPPLKPNIKSSAQYKVKAKKRK